MSAPFDRKAYWEARILPWERFRYGGWAWLWPPAWALLSRRRSALREACRLLPPNGSVLELGCGGGHFAAALAPRVGSYQGIDLAGAAVRAAAERVPGASFAEGDVLEAGLPPADLVVFLGLLDWLSPAETARLFERLRGRLLLFSFTEEGGPAAYRWYRGRVDRTLGRGLYRGRSCRLAELEKLAGPLELVARPWWNPGRLVVRRP